MGSSGSVRAWFRRSDAVDAHGPPQEPTVGNQRIDAMRGASSVEAAALAGVVCALLFSASTYLLERGGRRGPEAELTDWFADAGNRGTSVVGAYLATMRSATGDRSALRAYISAVRRRDTPQVYPSGMPVIDSDQHLVEYRGMWEELIDPAHRSDAIRMVDDELGYTKLVWNGTELGLAEVQSPGETEAIGDRHRAYLAGEQASQSYDASLPLDHWSPAARLRALDELGVDEAVLFPNFGLLWERTLDRAPAALLANMGAWNRWCTMVAGDGGGRLHPVAHVTLRDLDWLESQLRFVSSAGVRLAMIAPALVDGRPLSHPELDRAWSLFIEHGVSPVFHVADQTRPFDDAWYTDSGPTFVPTIESVFIWTAAALSCTDLVVNGVLERHPDLRLGIVELSAVWLPMFLLMLDGGVDFTTKLNGRAPAELSLRPSEYIFRQVRVSSFSYELPARLTRQLGQRDILMCCSDYPHSEGTRSPLADYAAGHSGSYAIEPAEHPDFFGNNVAMLLGR